MIRLSHWNGGHLAQNRNIGLGWLQRFVQRVLYVSGIICPLQQRLTLPGAAILVAEAAVLLHLRNMSSKCMPTLDLPIVVRTTPPHIISAIPLKPAARIFMIDPSLLLPVSERLGRAHAEVVQSRIVAFGTESGVNEPAGGEFILAVRHVLPAKNAKLKHLFRC